jgi:hypothetical protein
LKSLDLSSERVIAIRDRAHPYRFTVAAVSDKQWRKYFSEIISTAENKGRETVREFDNSRAKMNLFDAVAIRVDGYKDGPVELTPDLLAKVHASHKIGVANVLTGVTVVEPDDNDPLAMGSEDVHLAALWGSDESGNTLRFSNLIHRFAVPVVEHQLRYMRAITRSVVVGGRNGKTHWRGAQPDLIAIYDELIQDVEGYETSGVPLTGQPAIVAAMDAYHKVAAAEQLFRVALPEVEEAVSE